MVRKGGSFFSLMRSTVVDFPEGGGRGRLPANFQVIVIVVQGYTFYLREAGKGVKQCNEYA